MIQLVMDDNRIRFKINPTAASQAGLRISSKLLSLAQIVAPANASPPTGAAARHQITLKDQTLRTPRLELIPKIADVADLRLGHI